MANRTRSFPGWQILSLLLILGGIMGGWIGDLMVHNWPSIAYWGSTKSIGMPAFTVDLYVITLSFGFMIHISIFTLIGFLIAYLIYKRL
ncbi:MAG: DUF4321 domain-containing protein [Syntrophomonadaceae bacterium]